MILRHPFPLAVAAAVALFSDLSISCRDQEPRQPVAQTLRKKPPAPEPKAAVVDLHRLMTDCDRTKEMGIQLGRERAEISADSDRQLDRIRELKARATRIRTNPAMMPSQAAAVMALEMESTKLWRNLQDESQVRNAAFKERGDQSVKDLQEEILQEVRHWAGEQGYAWVFEISGPAISSAAPSCPVLLYDRDATDITDAVLDQLNWKARSRKQAEAATADPAR